MVCPPPPLGSSLYYIYSSDMLDCYCFLFLRKEVGKCLLSSLISTDPVLIVRFPKRNVL